MEVVQQILFLLLAAAAIFIFSKKVIAIRRNINLGRDEAIEPHPGRWRNLLLMAFGQKRMFDKPLVAILHFILYAGFIIINIEVLEIVLDGLLGTHRLFAGPLGGFYSFVINFFEVLAVLVLVTCIIFLLRRNVLKVRRLNMKELTKRTNAVAFSLLSASGGTLLLLNRAWYQHYARTGLHTFNDSREWLQVDKTGHAWSAYQMGRNTAALWQWAGVNEKKSVLLGSSGSLLFLTVIELMDGYSQKWGWSWADMAANGSGVALFVAQQLAWKDQRIGLKFSAAPQRISPHLEQRRSELFGSSVPEQVLKDYNNQTYWLSINPKSFMPRSGLPKWLNMAVGYGAGGMWGGFANRAFDPGGNLIFDRTDIKRSRQWYLSPDVDLTRIETNRKGIKTLLFLLNCVKLPALAVELSDKKLKMKWIQ